MIFVQNVTPEPSLPLEIARPRLQNQGLITLVKEIVETIILVAAIYALVNMLSARFVVDGPSMQPNFHTGQFVIVSRLNYMLATPERGDVIVFHYPRDPEEDYIKRVIGVPGDVVEIREQQVYVNGVALDEPYINEPCTRQSCPDELFAQLGPTEYFVMGDNRNHSQDSRSFGPVDRQFIVGEALVRYWPPSDWGLITRIGMP